MRDGYPDASAVYRSQVLEEPQLILGEKGVEVGEGASVESFNVKDSPPLEEALGRVV